MIRFNANGRRARFNDANPFFGPLPQVRQTLFKRAFGLLPEKHPVLRYTRDKDGAAIKNGPTHNYQENLVESRQFVQGVLETYATILGADMSQVVHAVTSGRIDLFINALEKRLKDRMIPHYEQTEKGSKRRDTLSGVAPGHIWTDDISKVGRDDIEKAVIQNWVSAAGVLTKAEQAAEGGEAAVYKLRTEQNAANKANYNTSRKDSMKGVQVVNARQKARQAVAAGA